MLHGKAVMKTAITIRPFFDWLNDIRPCCGFASGFHHLFSPSAASPLADFFEIAGQI